MAQPSAKAQRRAPVAPDSFLEALRELKTSAVSEAKVHISKAITDDIPQSFGFGSSGTIAPNESISMDQLQAAEQRGEMRAENRFNNRLQQERTVFLQSENETKQQIKAILNDIQMLAKGAGDLGKEVQIAAMQAPTNPGVYHRNFFEQLRTFVNSLRRKVAESRNWLATTNARAAGKSGGHYWSQAQKSGTKFTMSQERYMVTSTG